MLNKFKNLFKGNSSKQESTDSNPEPISINSSIPPITPEMATQLEMFYDEEIGQVQRIYYTTNEIIYLIATGGIFTINAKLNEPPVLINAIDNAPIAHLSFHKEKGFALIYGEGLCLWSSEEGKKTIDSVEGFSARTASWFSDGDKLFSGWAEDDSDWYGEGIARITNTEGQMQWEKKIEDGWVITSACGKSYFAFGSSTGSVWIYTNDYKETAEIELEGLDPLPEILHFDEDTIYIVSVDDNSEMRVHKWTPEKTELIEQETVTGHNQACISTDNRIAFITGKETKNRKPSRIYIKSLTQGTEKSAAVDGDVRALDFSPDCKSLALIDESGIKTISSANGQTKVSNPLNDSADCNNITISEYSKYIANWGPKASKVIFLSKEDGKEIKRMAATGVWSAIFLPNGNLAIATPEGLLYLDPDKEEVITTSVTENISQILLLHDKQTLLMSSSVPLHHQLIIYNMLTNATKYIPCHEGSIHKVIELIKYDLLLTFSARDNADFYNIEQDKCIKRLTTRNVSVSPDENYFAWVDKTPGVKSKDICISKGINGQIDHIILEPRIEHLSRSIEMTFSPDSKKLLVSGDTTAIIDLETLHIIWETELQGNIKWSPTGDLFVIGGAYPTNSKEPFRSNRFIIFDKDGNALAEYKVKRRVRDLLFSYDGSKIIVLCEYGGVFIFKVKPDK